MEERNRVTHQRDELRIERERLENYKKQTPLGAVETLEIIRRLTDQRDGEKMQRLELESRLAEVEAMYTALQNRVRGAV